MKERPILFSGAMVSCGCHKHQAIGERARSLFHKHGGTGTKIYYIHAQMKNRCFNPKARSYPPYGGRGITVCQEWKDSFVAFREWALSNGYEEGLSIDRIENDGNYEPGNCRWIPMIEQAKNTRQTRYVIYQGEKIPIREAAKRSGVSHQKLRSRLRNECPEEELFLTSNRKRKLSTYTRNIDKMEESKRFGYE